MIMTLIKLILVLILAVAATIGLIELLRYLYIRGNRKDSNER
jgi:hypothetical protein